MQEREVKAKHQQLISGVCFTLQKNPAKFVEKIHSDIYFMIKIFCSGFSNFILGFNVHMGLHQFLISFNFCHNSLLCVWYVPMLAFLTKLFSCKHTCTEKYFILLIISRVMHYLTFWFLKRKLLLVFILTKRVVTKYLLPWLCDYRYRFISNLLTFDTWCLTHEIQNVTEWVILVFCPFISSLFNTALSCLMIILPLFIFWSFY